MKQVKELSKEKITLLIFYSLAACLSVFVQVMTALVELPFDDTFALGSQQLAFLTSLFFFFLAVSLIPVGILIDKFGPKIIQTALLFIGGIGILIFALAHEYYLLVIGRILMGIGMSSGFVTGLKAVKLWFSEKRFKTINMTLVAATSFGALLASYPLEICLEHIHWRPLLIFIAVLFFVLACIFVLFVPIYKHQDKETVRPIGEILSNKNYWKLLVLSALCFGTYMAYQSLWISKWLQDGLGLPQEKISIYLFIISIAAVLGIISYKAFVFFGQKLRLNYVSMVGFYMIFYIGFQIALIYKPLAYSYIPWFFFGFFVQAIFLSLLEFAKIFSANQYGKVITFFLFFIYIAAFIIQYLVGATINLWPMSSGGNFGVRSFHSAFWIIAIINLAALVWFFMMEKGEENHIVED
ncbi:MAG: MFS transporter [Rhabdochlamydiaceae bacterium]|nr:MFS transporter [Candidatus Amphrikana amoebophyrae]